MRSLRLLFLTVVAAIKLVSRADDEAGHPLKVLKHAKTPAEFTTAVYFVRTLDVSDNTIRFLCGEMVKGTNLIYQIGALDLLREKSLPICEHGDSISRFFDSDSRAIRAAAARSLPAMLGCGMNIVEGVSIVEHLLSDKDAIDDEVISVCNSIEQCGDLQAETISQLLQQVEGRIGNVATRSAAFRARVRCAQKGNVVGDSAHLRLGVQMLAKAKFDPSTTELLLSEGIPDYVAALIGESMSNQTSVDASRLQLIVRVAKKHPSICEKVLCSVRGISLTDVAARDVLCSMLKEDSYSIRMKAMSLARSIEEPDQSIIIALRENMARADETWSHIEIASCVDLLRKWRIRDMLIVDAIRRFCNPLDPFYRSHGKMEIKGLTAHCIIAIADLGYAETVRDILLEVLGNLEARDYSRAVAAAYAVNQLPVEKAQMFGAFMGQYVQEPFLIGIAVCFNEYWSMSCEPGEQRSLVGEVVAYFRRDAAARESNRALLLRLRDRVNKLGDAALIDDLNSIL